MIINENEYNEHLRVTSSCWLSKNKINSFENKKKNSSKKNTGICPNFNICPISVTLPIIKLKNDLDCISENKQINRLREKKNKGKIQEINFRNEDEISSILLRSKAFNETWNLLNNFMNCFIYNYLNEMIEKEINFLNNNLCLKDDKLSLLIIKTQSCSFVNLLQYRIISQKLKKLNNCDQKEKKEKNVLEDDILNYKSLNNQSKSFVLLKKEKYIISCIINAYSNDTVESIISRIIKKINSNVFIKIDKNNLNDLFNKILKKKNSVLIIFMNNYLKLKASTFNGILLYLTHLKELHSVNISVIITNNCVLSALSNLDHFIKKNFHVNICNLYLNYYNLIENIIFSPIFNNIIFKIKEYNSLIDHIFFCNHNFSFLKLKYFFYLFIRDFYDKKILSFLNIPLIYFNNKNETNEKSNNKDDYTNNFNEFKFNLIESFDLINVENIHEKFILLLFASNFYEKHINYLKYKSNYHFLYIENQLNKKSEKNIKNNNKNGNKCNSLLLSKRKRENIKVANTSILDDHKSNFEKENIIKKKNNKIKNSIMEKLEEKEEKYNGNICKKKRKINLKYSDKIFEENVDVVNKRIMNKEKKENESLFNCIMNFNFMKCEYEYDSSNNNSSNKKIINRKKENNNNNNNNNNDGDGNERSELSKKMNNNNEKEYLINEANMSEINFYSKNDSIKKKLKINEKFKNFYFQNYSTHYLSEGLSPINRLIDGDFINNCNVLKQYVINNISIHMKSEHNFDSFKMLKKEWSNNEYKKIYKYEQIASNMERHLNKEKKKKKRNKKFISMEENIIKQKKIEEENTKKMLLLYLHKSLTISISKKMINFLYKKKKYNMSLVIINTILKNIPTYSSLRRRIKFLKELYKKYEQKFYVKTEEDLKKANDEIEKELKQTLNTICDILINLYINKIHLLKKIMYDIYEFLKNVSYVNKLESYVNKNNSLNLSIFFVKLNHLIAFINFCIDLRKKKGNYFDEVNKNNVNYLNQENYILNSESKKVTSYSYNNYIYETPKKIHSMDNFNINNEQIKLKNYGICENICNDEIKEKISINKNEECNSKHLVNGFISPDIYNQTYSTNQINLNSQKNKQKKSSTEMYLKKFNDSNIDLNFLEFLLVFFCEYFYFLLLPCIFLLPLSNECIIHDHGSEFFNIFNINLQMKLLHILYYNKLDVKYLNNSNVLLNHNFYQIKNNLKNSDIKMEGCQNNTDIKGNKIIPLNNIEGKSKIEDVVILFKIMENMKAKYINGCNMFFEYINMKLNSNYENNIKEPLYGETFQELFYQFIIAVMSLFYFMKIIYIPSSFVKSKNELEMSINYDEHNSNTYDKNSIHEKLDKEKIKEGVDVDLAEISDEKKLTKDSFSTNEDTISSFDNEKYIEDFKYKNYILDKLYHINIKKLIFGKNYIV
ncbi:conserved Plasmodium protein, unknown function [Plasmodium gallinaceum]|uniref:Uncharacterized protein n=1 Tax=Plasmodium gallinaceum TaxID=5849 RepID=A0A1J1H060_PLAGA|nr:conserved Plasmodium protein, unknown function [Plasmodium gallinaceum]CRG96668.1 conserved Plasmodium protein, unknown function [Plasmodium gallinaceum]